LGSYEKPRTVILTENLQITVQKRTYCEVGLFFYRSPVYL